MKGRIVAQVGPTEKGEKWDCKGCNEMVFTCLDSALGCVTAMAVWWDEL